MTRIALGVDAGASKTHAVVAAETGHVLGVGKSGTANWEIVGLNGAQAALRRAIWQALEMGNVAPQQISSACYGLAGLDWPGDETRLAATVAELGLGGQFSLFNDAFLPLRAGTPDGIGLAAIAGSGACVAGRNQAGETARSLGGSYPLTDWGGAWDIALAAIHAVARAYMGMEPQTALTERLLAAAGCADVPAFLEGLMRDRVEIGGEFAPQVAQVANEGDEAAQEIFRRAGHTVGENAVSIARRLSMLDTEFVLVTAGGVFSSRNVYLNESLSATLQAAAPRVRLVHWDAPPVIGAALLALDQLALSRPPDTVLLAGQVTAALAE